MAHILHYAQVEKPYTCDEILHIFFIYTRFPAVIFLQLKCFFGQLKVQRYATKSGYKIFYLRPLPKDTCDD